MQQFWCAVFLSAALATASAAPLRQQGDRADVDAAFDHILDINVRDGYVYYRSLKADRAALDRYVASLDVAPEQLARMSENDRRAFWVNAYNAIVMRTVINAYPIRGKASAFPASSVRQIPGAFDKVRHRVARQVLTLDEIENLIAAFGDARLLLALGRGSIGSGRLRSEVYRGARLDEQLTDAVKGFIRGVRNLKLDREAGTMWVTPLFSWRGAHFIASFSKDAETCTNRTPLERAICAMAYPHLFPTERAFLDLNTFRMTFSEFDWRLNDLTGGIPE